MGFRGFIYWDPVIVVLVETLSFSPWTRRDRLEVWAPLSWCLTLFFIVCLGLEVWTLWSMYVVGRRGFQILGPYFGPLARYLGPFIQVSGPGHCNYGSCRSPIILGWLDGFAWRPASL